MKVYRKLVIDLKSGTKIAENFYDYFGPLAETKSGSKSTTVVNVPPPPPPSTAELRAQNLASAAQEAAIQQAGFDIVEDPSGAVKLVKRSLTAAEQEQTNIDSLIRQKLLEQLTRGTTPEEQQRLDIERQVNEKILARLKGTTPEISPEARALVEKEFGSARERGLSELETFGRMTREELGRIAKEAAAARGMSILDTPIGAELARRESELGQDLIRQKSNLELGLGGAQAGAVLDLSQRQQQFLEGTREFQQVQAQAGEVANRQFISALSEFQQNLQQQAFLNRLRLSEAATSLGLGLGNIRTGAPRGSVTTTTTTGGGGFMAGLGATGSVLSGAGGLALGLGPMGLGLFSSKELKENIEELSDKEISVLLVKIAETPVYAWNYKPELSDFRRHIGPITEEAPSEIVSEDKMALVPIDYMGMMFAAIKALAKKVNILEQANGLL